MQQKHAEALLILAGIEWSYLYPIENEYWGNGHELGRQNPWWLVNTQWGLIKIGWRKRVINIDWSDTDYRGVITQDNVTKSGEMVHAWGHAKAVEYLAALRIAIGPRAAAANKERQTV